MTLVTAIARSTIKTAAARRAVVVAQPQQRRTFLDWMTNYPDRINELKKAHQAGGRSIFTWQKQSGDMYVNMGAVGLLTIGILQLVPGYYRLASGKGKME